MNWKEGAEVVLGKSWGSLEKVRVKSGGSLGGSLEKVMVKSGGSLGEVLRTSQSCSRVF